MTAIEIDERAIRFLSEKLPGLRLLHGDVLDADWATLAAERGGPLSVIGNLPYHIVSQVLFSLADRHKAIERGVFTMQLEVAERLTARPNSKEYGIPSVIFQLYGKPRMLFKIPPSVFYPQPKVNSALLSIDFSEPSPLLHTVYGPHLRSVVTQAFNQRRKMLRVSLKGLLEKDELVLPSSYQHLRPEQLHPEEFIHLTHSLYGGREKEMIEKEKLDRRVVYQEILNMSENERDSKGKEKVKILLEREMEMEVREGEGQEGGQRLRTGVSKQSQINENINHNNESHKTLSKQNNKSATTSSSRPSTSNMILDPSTLSPSASRLLASPSFYDSPIVWRRNISGLDQDLI